MTRCVHVTSWGVMLAWLLVMPAEIDAADAVWSVAKLNEAKGDWANLTDNVLTIQGRVGPQSAGQFRMQLCSLNFVVTPEQQKGMQSAKQVEVTGRIRLVDGSPQFEVSQLRATPTDLEQLQSRQAGLNNPQPQDWYALATWARSLGEFYSDRALLDEARQCVARGIAGELVRLTPDDATGRLELAKKAHGLGLPEKLVDEIRHEGYRVWWLRESTAKTPKPEGLAELTAKLRTDWPEAFEPVAAFPSDLARDYAANPTETYRLAEATQRPMLRRMFVVELLLLDFKRQLAADGRNGEELAALIEAQTPERQALAAAYRQQGLTYRLQQVGSASRSEALRLADQLREQERPQDAVEALRLWVTAKERRLRPEAAPEFIELADDYRTLLRDERRAVALLTEAHRREPLSAEVRQRFDEWGYEFNGVTWVRKLNAAMPAEPNEPATQVDPTRLHVGMTTEQLTQLLGAPTTRTRVSSRGDTELYWVYGRSTEGTRLVIEFRRAGPAAPYLVTRFYQR